MRFAQLLLGAAPAQHRPPLCGMLGAWLANHLRTQSGPASDCARTASTHAGSNPLAVQNSISANFPLPTQIFRSTRAFPF
jgi:hypothetical protein